MNQNVDELRVLLEKYYPIYNDRVVEPALAELASLEDEISSEFAGKCRSKVTISEIQEFANSKFLFRAIERGIAQRRRVMERLVLDGPGDWLI